MFDFHYTILGLIRILIKGFSIYARFVYIQSGSVNFSLTQKRLKRE